MIAFIQLLLAVVITSLSFMLILIGFQIFHLFHEFRQSVKKLNRILDNTRELSETASRPVTAVNQFFTEVKDLVDVTRDQMIRETPDKVIPVTTAREHKTLQRFFRRSGLPLRSS